MYACEPQYPDRPQPTQPIYIPAVKDESARRNSSAMTDCHAVSENLLQHVAVCEERRNVLLLRSPPNPIPARQPTHTPPSKHMHVHDSIGPPAPSPLLSQEPANPPTHANIQQLTSTCFGHVATWRCPPREHPSRSPRAMHRFTSSTSGLPSQPSSAVDEDPAQEFGGPHTPQRRISVRPNFWRAARTAKLLALYRL